MKVIWHDLECGSYAADLPLWRRLAEEEGGPVLDLGAGTGRVSRDLAGRGHEVWALDHDETLLAALRERAGDLPVRTVRADAREFALPRRFPLVLAPMQTMQLLGGRGGRRACLRCVRAHLAAGGLFAAALAPAVEGFDADRAGAGSLPVPDVREADGIVYSSRPIAVRDDEDGFVLERLREVVDARGRRDVERDAVRLDRLDAGTLGAEAEAEGFRAAEPRPIPPTGDHVGSEVAMLRG